MAGQEGAVNGDLAPGRPQAPPRVQPWGHPEAMRRPEWLLGRKWEILPSFPQALSLLSKAGVFLELECS